MSKTNEENNPSDAEDDTGKKEKTLQSSNFDERYDESNV
jgi:hypothetical protein